MKKGKRDIYYFIWDDRDETIIALKLYLANLNVIEEEKFTDNVFNWSCKRISGIYTNKELIIIREEKRFRLHSDSFFEVSDRLILHDGNIFRYINENELEYKEVNYINIREYFRNEKINNILSL